jgi:hypothetical protein
LLLTLRAIEAVMTASWTARGIKVLLTPLTFFGLETWSEVPYFFTPRDRVACESALLDQIGGSIASFRR